MVIVIKNIFYELKMCFYIQIIMYCTTAILYLVMDPSQRSMLRILVDYELRGYKIKFIK